MDAGAKPIKAGDTIAFTPRQVTALIKMDKWATKVLRKAGVHIINMI